MSDDNVVKLPKPSADRRVWTCLCGCQSMNMMANGTVECGNCDAVIEPDRGGWNKNLLGAKDYAGAEPFTKLEFGTTVSAEQMARRRVLKIAEGEDVASVVVVRNDGTISTWTHISDKKRHGWLRGRLSAAWMLMKPGGPSA